MNLPCAFRNTVFALLLVALLLNGSPPVMAQADGDSPWGDVVDENGHLRYDELIDLGETVEDAEWMDIELPFGMELDLDANYHRYQTQDGDIVVLPTPLTVMMMAMNPVESGLSDAQSQLGLGGFVGAEFLGALLGDHIDWNRLGQSNPDYANPDNFLVLDRPLKRVYNPVIIGGHYWYCSNATHPPRYHPYYGGKKSK